MPITEEAIRALVKTEATQASNAALNAAVPALAGQGLFVLHSELKTIDLEDRLPLRRRARGTMATEFVAPFAQYAMTHALAGACVFIRPSDMSATALLNFGSNDAPGHCDNKSKLTLKPTASYNALLDLVNSPHDQRDFSDWLEEWGHMVKIRESYETPAADAGDTPVSPDLDLKQCINAVRNVTIKAVQDSESTVGNFSQTRSAAEQIAMQAKADTKLPPFLHITFQPYKELQARTFVVRVSSITSRDAPVFKLQVLAYEQHQEEMANEFADAVRAEFDTLATEGRIKPEVLIGEYTKA